MAGIVLDRADIALWSDVEGTRLVLNRTQALDVARKTQKVFVTFEGDVEPTPFAGVGRSRVYQMTTKFLTGEHQALADLVALFDLADSDADADGRLMLRPHLGEVAELNPVEAVVVYDVHQTFAGAGEVDLVWTAQTVAYSLEV